MLDSEASLALANWQPIALIFLAVLSVSVSKRSLVLVPACTEKVGFRWQIMAESEVIQVRYKTKLMITKKEMIYRG